MSRKSDNAFPRRFTIQEEARTQLGRAWQGYLRCGFAVSALLCEVQCDRRTLQRSLHLMCSLLSMNCKPGPAAANCCAGGPLCGGRPAT
jgi:hypothetical protein